jgi:hypothetical protein
MSTHYFGIWAILLFASTTFSEELVQETGVHGRQGWTSSPNYRGTWELLLPCVSTVFLCCWMAYHPDIFQPDSPWLQRYLDRTVAFIIDITFPEVYLYTAFYENLDAKIALENIPAKIRTLWTTTHVYYANSGGFAIEYTVQGELPRNGKRCVYLTAPTVRWLLEQNRIDLTAFPSREAIEDKSKSDPLAKAITVMHIIWFSVQCIGRTINISRSPPSRSAQQHIYPAPCSLTSYGGISPTRWQYRQSSIYCQLCQMLLTRDNEYTKVILRQHFANTDDKSRHVSC